MVFKFALQLAAVGLWREAEYKIMLETEWQ